MSNNGKITVTIDNQSFKVEKGLTILEAAQENDIYIPTLCAHKDLTPHGGCRMCIVEVDGMRGFPTSCTTPVEDGMVIRTHTVQIEQERKEILQLFLSEHTASCLICDEKDECRDYMGTIRKAGVTTGCRFCPKDGQCELQEVVEKMKIDTINYPIYYRQLRIEKEDPFYDRDYNLCILCGRCIRMCQEVRIANVLSFKQRGRHTVIGPAYDRTHLEAGCEFCGACVSVCPTGALYEKAKKWDGKADKEINSTCSFCGVGCQIKLLEKNNMIIGCLPEEDDLINKGQLCVKGRFGITETVNGYNRIKKPYIPVNGTDVYMSWEKAVDKCAEVLKKCNPEQFGMLISPNCTNEDMYIAQKFTRTVMKSNNIDTSARLFYGPGFNSYLNLFKRNSTLSEVRKSDCILCIGLDAKYGRSVVGVEIRRAIRRGVKIVTINPKQHSISLIAEKWLQPIPGKGIDLLKSLEALTNKSNGKKGKADQDIIEAGAILNKSKSCTILVGSEFLNDNNSDKIFDLIYKIAENIGAGILPLPTQNNFIGSILMGAYPEILPGGKQASKSTNLDKFKKKWKTDITRYNEGWDSNTLIEGKKQKALYLIGEMVPSDKVNADYLIFQNIYPPEDKINADIILPSTAFTESEGSSINGEGRIQKINKAVNVQGEALPDWLILCKIAQKMGKEGFDFKNVREIRAEITEFIDEFKTINRKPLKLDVEGRLNIKKAKSQAIRETDKKYPFLLTASVSEHIYKGYSLPDKVEGLKKLFPEKTLYINPADARKAKIKDGDTVSVCSSDFEKVWTAKISGEQPQGFLHVKLRQEDLIPENPHAVKIRK